MKKNKKLRVAVITQNDNYAIPKNFMLLCDSININVKELIIVNSSGSLENKKLLFFRGFGAIQSLKIIMTTIFIKLKAFLALNFKLAKKKHWLDLKGLALTYKVPLREEKAINSESVLKRLSQYDLDVIVSFSAPTIFKPNLLNLPKYGCINLHCSMLPSYAGVMPSFWVLYNNEDKAGVSVHLMDSKIDNGDVLAQEQIDIININSMFELIKVTKLCGGKLMLKVLEYIQKNKNLPNVVDTSYNMASYFSWPNVDDFRSLSLKGKKLI